MNRKQSLLYELEGKKPSLLEWYVLRFIGHISKNNEGIYVYLKPYWLWKILNKRVRQNE